MSLENQTKKYVNMEVTITDLQFDIARGCKLTREKRRRYLKNRKPDFGRSMVTISILEHGIMVTDWFMCSCCDNRKITWKKECWWNYDTCDYHNVLRKLIPRFEKKYQQMLEFKEEQAFEMEMEERAGIR